jgi:hypothetical protein
MALAMIGAGLRHPVYNPITTGKTRMPPNWCNMAWLAWRDARRRGWRFLFCRLRRKPFLVAADELTVPAAFLMGIGRIGNFIEGGVIGSVTAMPWGVIFPGVEGPRHPVALYDGAKNLLLVPVLILILRRWPAGRGVATGAFLFLYAGSVPRRPVP